MKALVVLLLALLALAGASALATAGVPAAAPGLPPKAAETPADKPLDQDEVMAICTVALVAAMSGDPDPLAPLLKAMPEPQARIVGMICVAFLNGAYIHRQLTTRPEPTPAPADAIPLANAWMI